MPQLVPEHAKYFVLSLELFNKNAFEKAQILVNITIS